MHLIGGDRATHDAGLHQVITPPELADVNRALGIDARSGIAAQGAFKRGGIHLLALALLAHLAKSGAQLLRAVTGAADT